MKRRVFFIFLLVVCILVAIGFAYYYFSGYNKQNVVRIGITPFQDTVLPVIPEKLGWYKKDGYTVKFVDVGWSDVSLGLASNEFDVIIYTFDSLLPSWPSLKKGGKELIYYAPLYVFKGAAIMVRGDEGYDTLPSLKGLTKDEVARRTKEVIQQLIGKKIGITEGTTAERVVRAALEKGGVAKSKVELIHARYEDNLAAFLAGSIDAFVGGVTERIQARKSGAVELIVGSAVSVPVVDGWVTRRDFAEENPEVMQSLIDNFFRVVRYMEQDLVGNAHLATEYLKGKASIDYSPKEYMFAWNFQYFPKTRDEASKTFLDPESPYYWKGIWAENNKFLLKQGKINNAVPFDAFWGEKTLPQTR